MTVLWLEPSDNFASQKQAEAEGAHRNQIAIFDPNTFSEIPTGGSGGGRITEHDASGRAVRTYHEGASLSAGGLPGDARAGAAGRSSQAGHSRPAGIAAQVLELAAWQHEARGPHGEWVKSPQFASADNRSLLARRAVETALRARQHANRRAAGNTWTVDEQGQIIRHAHPAPPRSIADAMGIPPEPGFQFPRSGNRVNGLPEKGDIAFMPAQHGRSRLVGRIVARAGLVAAVDADDGNRYHVDIRNGKILKKIPLSQAGPALPASGPPWAEPAVLKAFPPRPSETQSAYQARIQAMPMSEWQRGVAPFRTAPPAKPVKDTAYWHALGFRTPKATAPGEEVAPGVKQYILPGMESVTTEYGQNSAPVQKLRKLLPEADEILARGRNTGDDRDGYFEIPHQGIQGSTKIVTLRDGTKVIVKTQDPDRNDREELSYYVSQAIGGGLPAIARDPKDPRRTVQEYVDGVMAERYTEEQAGTGGDWAGYHPEDIEAELANNPASDIGLLDYLTSNGDRHNQNWMVTPDGHAVPIDMGSAKFDDTGTGSPFWQGGDSYSNPIDPDPDWAEQVLKSLAPLQQEFTRAGHPDWFANMMEAASALGGDLLPGDVFNRLLAGQKVTGFSSISGQLLDLAWEGWRTELRNLHGEWASNGGPSKVLGDPKTAKHVIVMVPGVGSATDQGKQSYEERAQETKLAADAQNQGSTAVVLWGYNSPASDKQAIDPGSAVATASRLAAYEQALHQANPGAHITVIGHSYGSLVSGIAARRHGMHPDDLVFVGSPGVGAAHARELGMPAGHVWAGAEHRDPVARLASVLFPDFRGNPDHAEFGAKRFAADSPDVFPGWEHGGAHSSYWGARSQALGNMAAIATGRYEAVTRAHDEARLLSNQLLDLAAWQHEERNTHGQWTHGAGLPGTRGPEQHGYKGQFTGADTLRPGMQPATGHEPLSERGRPEGIAQGTAADPVDVRGNMQRAVELMAAGQHVRLNGVSELPGLMDEINRQGDAEMKRTGSEPPWDLGNISVRGTRLFNEQTIGTPRQDMPQLNGPARPGSEAAVLAGGASRFVELDPQFRAQLHADGIAVKNEHVPVSELRATQTQLTATSVAGIYRAAKAGNPKVLRMLREPLWATRENYILDGHHRWAADTVLKVASGHWPGGQVEVQRINLPVYEAVQYAGGFAQGMGIGGRALGNAKLVEAANISGQLDLSWRDAWMHELRGPHGEWVRGAGAPAEEKWPGEHQHWLSRYWQNEADPAAKQNLNLAGASYDSDDYLGAAEYLRRATVSAANLADPDRYEKLAASIESDAMKGDPVGSLAKRLDSIVNIAGIDNSAPDRQKIIDNINHAHRLLVAAPNSADEGYIAGALSAAAGYIGRAANLSADGSDLNTELEHLEHLTVNVSPKDATSAGGSLRVGTQNFVGSFASKVPGWLGGGKESWKGQVNVVSQIDGNPAVEAALDWDRLMSVREDVARNIQTDLLMTGEPVNDPESFSVPLHEMIHGVVEDNNDVNADKDAYQDLATATIEEGFTELGMTHHMPEYLKAVGVADRPTFITVEGAPENPDYAHRKEQVYKQLRDEAARLRTDKGPHDYTTWAQVAEYVDQAANDISSDYPEGAKQELYNLAHLGDKTASSHYKILMDELKILESTPIAKSDTMAEYATRLQDPARVARGDAWGHYPEQTKAAQEWVQEIAKNEAGDKPFDSTGPGSPDWKRVVELSDEINRVGTQAKVQVMAEQAARALGVDIPAGSKVWYSIRANILDGFNSRTHPSGKNAFYSARAALKTELKRQAQQLQLSAQVLELGWEGWRTELRDAHGRWTRGATAAISAGLKSQLAGIARESIGLTPIPQHKASPEIHAFTAKAAQAMPGILGGGTQGFSGKVRVTDELSQPGSLAMMEWNGDMLLRSDVADQLQHALTSDQPSDPGAAEDIEHELIHGVTATESYRGGFDENKDAYQDLTTAKIEEGFTELGAIQHAGEFFKAMGIDSKPAPDWAASADGRVLAGKHATYAEMAAGAAQPAEIASGNSWGHYGPQVAAAYGWAEAIAEMEGAADKAARIIELADQVNQRGAAGKADVMAAQVLSASARKLPGGWSGLHISPDMLDGIRQQVMAGFSSGDGAAAVKLGAATAQARLAALAAVR